MIGEDMKRVRILAASLMISIVLLLTGCGSTTMLEEYSFGHTQLVAGQSEIFMMTPFQLGKAGQKVNYDVMYAGSDVHINLLAAAEPAVQAGKERITPRSLAEASISELQKTTDITNLQTKITDTTVNEKPAVAAESTYDAMLKDGKASLVVKSLFFEDNGQIWYVMYMYRNGDDTGKEVTDYIYGKIK
jgi:hypothetical protein